MNLYRTFGLLLSLICDVMSGLILVRVVLSWLTMTGSETIGKLSELVSMVTDPILAPARMLLGKIPAAENMPLDFSPFLTIIFLSIISAVFSG